VVSRFIVTATAYASPSGYVTRVVDAASPLDAEGKAIDRMRAEGLAVVRIVRVAEVPTPDGATHCVCGAALESGAERFCAPCSVEMERQVAWRRRSQMHHVGLCNRCGQAIHSGACRVLTGGHDGQR
jgi:hypothetical protein